VRMFSWKRPCRIRGNVLVYVIRGTEVNTNNLASDIQCLGEKKLKTSRPKHISAILHCNDDRLSSIYSRCVGVTGALLEGTKI